MERAARKAKTASAATLTGRPPQMLRRKNELHGESMASLQPLWPTIASSPGITEQWTAWIWPSRCVMKSWVESPAKNAPTSAASAAATNQPPLRDRLGWGPSVGGGPMGTSSNSTMVSLPARW